MEVLQFIQTHWIEWLFAIITALLGAGYKNISTRLKAEQKKNNAIAEGVQSLLRESIVNNYNKYTVRTENIVRYMQKSQSKRFTVHIII